MSKKQLWEGIKKKSLHKKRKLIHSLSRTGDLLKNQTQEFYLIV